MAGQQAEYPTRGIGHKSRGYRRVSATARTIDLPGTTELPTAPERPSRDAFVILPLPGARLRDAGVRYPDFAVIGNGRAVIIEVDGVHHYAKTRKADDQDRDRCGVHTIRIPSEHTSNLDSLKDRLREDLNRKPWTR